MAFEGQKFAMAAHLPIGTEARARELILAHKGSLSSPTDKSAILIVESFDVVCVCFIVSLVVVVVMVMVMVMMKYFYAKSHNKTHHHY